jgi:two-component system sensor histidine kinase/response regulator
MPKLNFRDSSIKEKNAFWLELIGTTATFPLESRIFHSISLGLIVLAVIYVPYNLYAGLYVAALSALICMLIFVQQYYNSRVNGKPHSNILFGLTGIILLGVNYFTNSGINGSTDVIWPAYLLLVFTISPYNQHLRWLLVYLFGFLILHTVEHFHPELVLHPFGPGKGQFIDRITAFPLPVLLIYIIIKLIRQGYDKERIATQEKTIAIEKSKEQILLQKDQLEKSNMEKNKLMSIISHDLRAPLTNIQTYLEMLNDNEVDSADRPVLENALLKSTNGAMAMLSNLLHWSKSQMEGLNVNLLELDLLTVLTDTLEMEKILASKKSIVLNYQIQSKLTIIADVDMLQLVVRNLISNAIKFSPEGAAIHVSAEVIDVQCKLTVLDTGKGIAEDNHEKIFSIKSEPSFGTNNEKGVGLGLVLC